MEFSMCRVCLVGSSRMLDVDSIQLQEMYEKLTNTKFNAEIDNGMPSTLCYVCHRQLQKCHKFFNMAQKSNRILRELLHDTYEESHTTLMMPSQESMHHLVVTPIQHMSLGICLNTTSISPVTVTKQQVAVKEEIGENENIKLETIDEEVEKTNDSYNMEPSQEKYINVKTSSIHSCFYCDVCNKKMSSKYSLVKHLKVHMQVHTGEKPYPCNRCDKAFKYNSDFKRHMLVHTGEQPYPCNRCDKAFTAKDTLKRHMLVHTGEKLYPCNRCDKAFKVKSNMTRHMRVHTGEKPFICNSCDKAFKFKSNLTGHMRVHTGEKPYLCNRCDKAFRDNNKLIIHMRVHTGEKPYPCNRCDKAYTVKDALKRHIRVHSGEKPYSCNMCDKAYTQINILSKHIRLKHAKK